MMTVVKGFDQKNVDVPKIAKKLKSKLACGGTAKNGQIELQGDHKRRVKEVLADMGFSSDTIEIKDRDNRSKGRRKR